MKKWFAGCGNVKLFELHKKSSHLRVVVTNTVGNKYVIITSKRRFDIMITYLLRSFFAGMQV